MLKVFNLFLKKQLLALVVCLFLVSSLYSQNDKHIDGTKICIASDHYNSSKIIYSWSIGGPITVGVTSNDVPIASELLANNLNNLLLFNSDSIKIYPNLGKNIFVVRVNDINVKALFIEIYDLLDNLVYENKVKTSEKESIDINDLLAGSYFLKVYKNNNILIGVKKITKL